MLLDTTNQSLADYALQYGKLRQERIGVWELQHDPLDTIWEVYDFDQDNPEIPI